MRNFFEGSTIPHKNESKLLVQSAAAALLIELLFLIGISQHDQWFPRLSSLLPSLPSLKDKSILNEQLFLETQFFEMPPPAPVHLKEIKPKVIPTKKTEPLLSRSAAKTPVATPQSSVMEEQNDTQEGTKEEADHGPIALYAPTPLIPSYLRNQELKASVGIVFFITAQGNATPRLIRSCGNGELDAIALETVRKWKFQPATRAHKPIDSKVSLKIVFQVE